MRTARRTTGVALVASWLCAAPLACGGGIARVEKRVADLQGRVDEMAGAIRAHQSRLAAIENRVLVLQDEIETLRLAGKRTGPSGAYVPPAAAPASVPRNLPTVRVLPPEAMEGPTKKPASPPEAASLTDESIYQEIDDEGNVVPSSGGRRSSASAPPRRPALQGPPAAKPARREADNDAVIQEYQSALELYQQGRVVEARAAFEVFVARYPRHPYADNAQYWIGECLYDQRDFEGARREFLRVMTEHPDGNKVPDAMVKVGLCDRALGRHEDAVRMFRTVMLTYPDTEAAAVAMRLAGQVP